MGIVDYFRIPKRAWYWYRNALRNIPPPEWPVEGTPAQVKLSADKKVISPADGTDDVHVTVKVADAARKADIQCRAGDAYGGIGSRGVPYRQKHYVHARNGY